MPAGPLSGSLAGRLAGSLAKVVSSEAPASFMLDGLSAAPLAGYCLPARRISSYSGALYTGIRVTGGTLHDIPYVAGTNLRDAAAQNTAFSGSNATLDTIKDQMPGARHLAQGVTAVRCPKIYDSVTGALTLGGQQTALWDADDEVDRADALGLSGATAISAAFVWQPGATVNPGAFSIGTAAVGQLFEVWADGPTTITISISGASRSFTCPAYTTGVHSVIVTLAAGAGIGTAACYWNGVALAQSAVSNGSNTLNLGTGYTSMAANTRRAFLDLSGNLSELWFWNSVLSAGDIAAKFAADTVLYGTLG